MPQGIAGVAGRQRAPKRAGNAWSRSAIFIAGLAVAKLFFDIKMGRLSDRCPLEEAELIKPLADKTGQWVYERLGLNPIKLGCWLCICGGVEDHDQALAAAPSDVWQSVRRYFTQAAETSGVSRDAMFAPGPRIILQELVKHKEIFCSLESSGFFPLCGTLRNTGVDLFYS